MANLRLAPDAAGLPGRASWSADRGADRLLRRAHPRGGGVLRPLRGTQGARRRQLGPKPYASHQAVFDPAYPHGRGYYWKAWKLPPLTDRAIDVIVEQAAAITSPLSAIPIFTLGGAVAGWTRMPAPSPGVARRTTSTSSRRGCPTIPIRTATKRGRDRPGRRCGPSLTASMSTSCPTNRAPHVRVATEAPPTPDWLRSRASRPVERLSLQPEHPASQLNACLRCAAAVVGPTPVSQRPARGGSSFRPALTRPFALPHPGQCGSHGPQPGITEDRAVEDER